MAASTLSMATRSHEHDDSGEGATPPAGAHDPSRAAPADAAGRALGSDVRVVSRRTVVDGTVRHEIGFERRPGA